MGNAVGFTLDKARSTLATMAPQMQMVLPPSIKPERMNRIIMNALQTTPKLLECNFQSFMKAAMTVAYLGLEPEGVLGQAYLVPYKGEVQAQIGYKGLIRLARNSGEVASLTAHEVCEEDDFDYAYGLDEKLVHKPAEGERGKMTHVYAVAKFKDGSHHFEVLTKAQVDKVREGSAGKNLAPWTQHYNEMAKKTAIRRIAKYLPLSVQRAEAINIAFDAGRVANLATDGQVIEHEAIQVPKDEPIAEISKLEAFDNSMPSHDEDGVVLDEGDYFPGDTPVKSQTVAFAGQSA